MHVTTKLKDTVVESGKLLEDRMNAHMGFTAEPLYWLRVLVVWMRSASAILHNNVTMTLREQPKHLAFTINPLSEGYGQYDSQHQTADQNSAKG